MPRELYYPKIPDCADFPLGPCIAFEKYDGSNVHFRWERNFGWHAFGTRRDEFNLTPDGEKAFAAQHPELAETVSVFERSLANAVESVLLNHPRYASTVEFIIFAEFFGSRSFAGSHHPDDPKSLKLFDVWQDGLGLIGPQQFAEDFEFEHSARVVYRGRFTGTFVEAVREGKYDVVEGVVCKAGRGGDDLHLAKIKTKAFLQRLKSSFGNKWQDYWE